MTLAPVPTTPAESTRIATNRILIPPTLRYPRIREYVKKLKISIYMAALLLLLLRGRGLSRPAALRCQALEG